MKNRIFLYIITGISGSGKTVALKAFEDMGFYCVDNIPTILIPDFLEVIIKFSRTSEKIAIGVDIREEIFLNEFYRIYDLILNKFRNIIIKVVYLDAEDNVIVKRFKETRRAHPLGINDLKKAITIEREKLGFIKERADIYIETSNFNVHNLKKFIYNNFADETFEIFKVNIVSFGFKNGILSEADLIFDVRFLKNPFFVEELKNKTGNNVEVVNYVLKDKRVDTFLKYLKNLLEFLLPEYHNEGKNFIIIGIGCTGGMHRSVVIANKLAENLSSMYNVIVRHRDLTILEEEI